MAVRGTFDLNDRPASDALKRLRREGAETDATMDRLGRTVDKTFTTQNVEQGRRYERMLRDLDRTARTSLGTVRREWSSTERQTVKSVAVQEAAVDRLQVRLDKLGATRVSPVVDLDGVTEAIAQVELLQRRLSSLSRRTATPRVGMPSTFGGNNGRVPTTRGAGGSSGGFGGGLKIPFAGKAPWPLVGAGIAAVPPLLGGATALGGSLGAAALGAGSIGLGAAGVGGAALGLGLPVGITAAKEIKESSEALKKYREEVLKTGTDSKASRQALHAYNMALGEAPGGTRQFLRARTMLGEEFRGATAPARASFTRMGARGLNVGRQLVPTIGPLSNRFFGEAQQQTDQFGDFLAGGRSKAFINAMGNEATRTLGPAENIAEQGTETFMNLSRAARPFFREGIKFIDHWTEGWQRNSRDIKGVRSDMRGWVDQLKSWGKLVGATGRLGGDLLGAGAGSGRSMVTDLTKQLDEWDKWVERNPRKVRAFFRESVDTVEKIASGVGAIGKSLWQAGQLLAPLLGQATELLSLLSKAGLLTPGGLPLLLAGGAGVRAGTRGLGGRIRGTTGAGAAAGGAPVIIGAGGAAGAAAMGGAAFDKGTYSLARSFGRGRIASGLAGLGAGGVGTRGAAFARGFAGRFLPFAALSAGLGAATFQGDATERLQAGLSSTTLGLIPSPRTGAERQDEGLRHAGMVSSFQAQRFGNDPRGLRRQLLGLKRKIHTLGIPTSPEGLKGFLTGDIIGGGGPTEISDSARIEAEALAQRRRQIATQGLPGAELGDITGAYTVNARHGDPRKAAEGSARGIEQRIKRLRGNTAKEFGQMSLGWVRELAAADPKLRGTYNRMSETIENRLNRMGQNVTVIHGRIVDVSRKSWNQVADDIDTSTQRALSSANENLTALEKRAETILSNMGYTKTQAQSLIHEAQTGRPTKAGSAANVEAHHHGQQPATINNMPQGKHAGGGRLPMQGNGSMQDDIYLGNNQWGASGELMVNRHTERRVDRVLRLAGTSLNREVGRENRPHSKPIRETNAAFGRRLATGGIIPAATLAERMGMGVSGGPGPGGGIPSSGHVGDSLHYSGLAYDVTGSAAQMRRYFLTAARTFRGSINELFYDPMGYYYDQGRKVPGAIGGHSDHVHIGFFPSGATLAKGARLGGMKGMTGTAGAKPQIHLKGPRSGIGGIPGAAADQAGKMMAAGLSDRLNRLTGAGRGGGGAGGLSARGGSVSAQIARRLFAGGLNKIGAAGIIGNAYAESSLDPSAQGYGGGGLWGFTASPNSLSDLQAYASKRGAPWTNAGLQTDFLLQHVSRGLIQGLNSSRSPESAAALFMTEFERPGIPRQDVREAGARKAFKQGYGRGGRMQGFAGWFRDGFQGRVHGPTLMGVGEAGPEDVQITPSIKRRRGGHRGFGGGGHRIAVEVKMGGVTIAGSHDAHRAGKEIGERVAAEITKALEDSDGVDEKELVG